MDQIDDIRARIDPEADVLLAPPPVDDATLVSTQKSLSPAQAARRRFLRDKRAVISLAFVVIVIVGAFVFPHFYVHIGPTFTGGVTGTQVIGPDKYHTANWNELDQTNTGSTLFPLGPNSLKYPLGTDGNGRDVLARLMAGVNVSIILAFAVEIFDVGLGILFGSLAGFFGGWLDTVLARFTDIVFAFPGILLIILIGATLGPSVDTVTFLPNGAGRVVLLIGAIGFLAWPLMMRQVRGQTLQLKEQQFIEAARTVGTTNRGIITRHIIPNLLSIVIVTSTLNVLGTIVTEAAISLIGVGIQPPQTSLGLMISDAVGQIYVSWTELAWPGGTLVLLVIALAFIGDGVRDAFDPRTKD
jgi:ABC-type dipeptide/oligopeptide/nickel transport system permease subunit